MLIKLIISNELCYFLLNRKIGFTNAIEIYLKAFKSGKN